LGASLGFQPQLLADFESNVVRELVSSLFSWYDLKRNIILTMTPRMTRHVPKLLKIGDWDQRKEAGLVETRFTHR
jgi:hypothetical protein